MNIRSNAGRAKALATSLVTLLAILEWPQTAAAFHVRGVSIVSPTVNSVTRTVTIGVVESTGTPFGPHTGAGIQWGDAMGTAKAWTHTATNTAFPGINFYSVAGVSHIYPDLTDRTITVTSDCCGPSG